MASLIQGEDDTTESGNDNEFEESYYYSNKVTNGTLSLLLNEYTNASDTNTVSNGTMEMPVEMKEMSASAITSVIVYSVIWVIAAGGNLTVFASCYRQYKKHRSRITLLILHLSVADLIVTFCLIPIEIAWRITIQWYGGNVLCKICQFLRAFGLYLSSMVLICVSFDRFFAILFPLKFAQGKHRVKIMLGLAWVASGIFSTPQAIFFSVETHPKFPTFHQCMTSSFLSTQEDVRLYSIFSVSAMYFAPLLVIVFTYTAILLKIIRRTRSQENQNQNQNSSAAVMATTTANENGSTTSISTATTQSQITNQASSFCFTPSPNTKSKSMKFKFGSSMDSSSDLRWGKFRWGQRNDLQVPMGESSTEEEGRNAVMIGDSFDEAFPSPKPKLNGTSSLKSIRRTMSVRSNGRKAEVVLRMSNNATSNITRAKSRTLRLTIVIVLVFVLCWTPYVVMTLWYMFDWATAQRVDPRLQDALFMMAVANSCVNPLVYGSFTKNCCGLSGGKREAKSKSQKGKRPTTIKEVLESQASHSK